ncbi:MAG TPA: bifunctional demethylmenaquinone methyltransferase/2-methoxy-6-polyprenyl-1,4-benzoquinol methylase UbiE [Desulfosalsimonadaceae bacterium]|nr:bifunctional demethylmenaquinone methyltransferase/2-methoxy-6-polyprenyl-1,4-benzoquinol methylase UbiE [Desulfosalsimonadaceae bacterium]
MKLFNIPRWFDRDGREKMFDEYVETSGTAHFGLRQMRREEKEKAVRAHFNRVAPKYDFMNTLLSFGIHYAWKRTAVRMLDLKPGHQVLDVCGGTGDLAVFAARRIGAAGNVYVYDMNRAMMEAGRSRQINEASRHRLHYIQGDAECIAFPDNRFDAAMVGFGIRNLTHLKKGFSEMHRLLKPGGKIMCLEFSKPVNPLFRSLYDLYSFHVMPLLGSLLAGSSQSYSCLSETIRMFATALELKEILESIGFVSVFYKRLTNGIATVHVGQKSILS